MSTDNREVRIHDVRLDGTYADWLRDIKSRYRQSQIKAAVRVNSEKLLFNWQLGRDLVMRKAEERWGTGIVEQVSLDLQREFPGEGFSTTNVWYMKKWYLFYHERLHQLGEEWAGKILDQLGQVIGQRKLQQPVGELYDSDSQYVTKLQQVAGEFHNALLFPAAFGLVPWGHHVNIITKCKDFDEALYYLRRTIEGNWSRSFLLDRIKGDEYHRQQHPAVNNFADHLPEPQSLLAAELTKENYDLGFLTLPPNYTEKHLEEALCQHLTDFLLELGTGFAFIGRQKELVIAGKTRRIDLLFYHIRLRSYVVIELKSVPFEPEFAGKLNFYVNAVDQLVKHPDDNPTIGLLICRDKDEADVQLAFRGVTTPLGVASYENVQIAEIARQLPTVEQLTERLRLLDSELKAC